MKVVIQPEVSIHLDSVNILAVRDVIHEKRIIARVEGIPRGVILWGPKEYDLDEARNWTNESARNKAVERLSQENVPFE
jgi:hypothetical protein